VLAYDCNVILNPPRSPGESLVGIARLVNVWSARLVFWSARLVFWSARLVFIRVDLLWKSPRLVLFHATFPHS